MSLLQEIINREDLKLNDKGFVVWRSGMVGLMIMVTGYGGQK